MHIGSMQWQSLLHEVPGVRAILSPKICSCGITAHEENSGSQFCLHSDATAIAVAGILIPRVLPEYT